MNEAGQSLDGFKLFDAGLAARPGVAERKERLEGVVRKRRTRSLTGLIWEVDRHNRWEERVWMVMGALAVALLGLSLALPVLH